MKAYKASSKFQKESSTPKLLHIGPSTVKYKIIY